MSFKIKSIFLLFLLLLLASTAFAGPWLLPGNLSVKSDIDILADAGLIKAPVMTWPMAWVNIGPELLSSKTKAKLPKEPEYVQQAYQRIVLLYQQQDQLHKVQSSVYASQSSRLNPFRTFESEPYADFATGAATEYQTKHFAGSLNVSYYKAINQSYSNYVHLDNSYAYFLLGNWAIGVDQFNRWWGPGYSDSMILSQNAEPFPTITLQRMHAEAFDTKWLHWIGPWSLTSSLSENGPSFYPYPLGINNILFWFTNVSFRPLQSLQFDISRNVLFSGEQRPMNDKMLFYVTTLQDSYEPGIPSQEAPGSEEWDIGTRWSMEPAFKIPAALYLQTLFSDEGQALGGAPLPDCTTFLLGGSVDAQLGAGTLKTYFEYEYNLERLYYWWGKPKDSGPTGVDQNPYGGQYPYTYFNRLLGSALGSEGVGYTLGAILTENNGDSDTAMVRLLQLNSYNWGIVGTPGYPFAKQDVVWSSIGRRIVLPSNLGKLAFEIGYLQSVMGAGLSSGLSTSFTWSHDL